MEKKNNPSKGLKNQEIILKQLLAKSLVIFIGIGLISGLAFGVYLLDIKNTNQLVFVEGLSISVVTEKIDFKIGVWSHNNSLCFKCISLSSITNLFFFFIVLKSF